MKLESIHERDLEAWRGHPVTQTFFEALEDEAKRVLSQLENASLEGTGRRLRRLGGTLEGLRRAANIAKTRGKETE